MAARVCQQPARQGVVGHACRAWTAGCVAGVGALVGALATAGCADDGGPRLDSVTPPAAAHSATLTLAGRRLCGASGDCSHAGGEVQLGLDPPMVRVVVTSYSDTAATLVVPAAAPVGKTALIVTVNERSSNALDFEVLP
jgi:hypothetical protein